jgi:predicted RNA binding protein YcfA (HicA-like mRNA interferase family)
VKRDKLIRYLTDAECELLREGGRHSIYRNTTNRQTAPVPRHREIDALLVLKICKELGIEPPTGRA